MQQKRLLLLPLPLLIIGCMNTPEYPVNAIPPKQTAVAEEPNTTKHLNFKNDRVSDFDYNRLGYYSDDGAYFGYFDRRGYYCDDIFYPYDDHFRYEDRMRRGGQFAPTVRHYRVYREDDGGGNYYYVPDRHYIKNRPHHPVHYEEHHLGSGSYRGLTYEGN
ncbi:MAG TPA: hypothetical protein ENK86_05970 [Campylobacterales bacterium]|nr:hypothetical protein [Campylobacterales bacterium]